MFLSTRFKLVTLLCIPAFLCIGPASHLDAQAAPAKPGISCSIRHTPLSPGDIAYSHSKFDDAAGLYLKESQAPGDEGERAHNGRIRSLLHADKVADADADARTWVAAAPADAWAQDSVAEIQFHKANIDAAGIAMRNAVTANFCNARAHADYAEYLDFAGYHASAKSQIDIAHKLDPMDDDIATSWIPFQPRAVRLEALNNYLANSKFLTDKERKNWESERNVLSGPADPCALKSSLVHTTIPFRALRNHNGSNGGESDLQWGLVVNINGKPRRLEIDTGASGILLKRSAATGLGLEAQAQTEIQGAGDQGSLPASIRNAAVVKIGDVELHDCPITVMEKDIMISSWDADIQFMEGQDGLIGPDVFQDFLLTLDYPGHVVKLDPLPAPPASTPSNASNPQLHDRFIDPSMSAWTKVFRTQHELFVPVRMNNGPTHLFLVDTGWGGDTEVSTSAAREVAHVERTTVPYGGVGVSGQMDHVHLTDPISLDFGGLRQPPAVIQANDSGFHFADTQIDGVLSQTTLRQLTIQIDYRDQLVRFSYDPSRIRHCVPGMTIEDCYP